MVEKRQTRSEAASATEDSLAGASTDDAGLETLPGDVRGLKMVVDKNASELLELAEQQVAEARRRLGPETIKPRMKRVEELFAAHAGKPPRVSEDLERSMRSSALVAQVATLDGTFDHSVATGYNIFDKASVQAGAAMQVAYDDWQLAVRMYRSELRAGGSTLLGAIEIANHPPLADDFEQPLRGESQVSYFTRTDKIGVALLAYEKRIQSASVDLAKAYGTLIGALYAASSGLAVAEATLIAVIQTANKTFWTGIQNAVSQVRS